MAMDPTCYGESIYNLIPSDWKKPIPPPRYTSVFRTAIKDDIKKSKASMKTMGPAKVEVPSPKDFLKKHSKEKSLPPKKKFEWNEPRKPPVPQKTDHPIMGIQNEKNFININVTDVIMGVTKKHKAVIMAPHQNISLSEMRKSRKPSRTTITLSRKAFAKLP